MNDVLVWSKMVFGRLVWPGRHAWGYDRWLSIEITRSQNYDQHRVRLHTGPIIGDVVFVCSLSSLVADTVNRIALLMTAQSNADRLHVSRIVGMPENWYAGREPDTIRRPIKSGANAYPEHLAFMDWALEHGANEWSAFDLLAVVSS